MSAAPPSPSREGREDAASEVESAPPAAPRPRSGKAAPAEIGGPKGPEPTRYGDWERNGRCSDF